MILPIYLIIGLIYWAINSFVRKLETDDDYLLPLVWFLFWPLAAITWSIIVFQCLKEYCTNKLSKNQF